MLISCPRPSRLPPALSWQKAAEFRFQNPHDAVTRIAAAAMPAPAIAANRYQDHFRPLRSGRAAGARVDSGLDRRQRGGRKKWSMSPACRRRAGFDVGTA